MSDQVRTERSTLNRRQMLRLAAATGVGTAVPRAASAGWMTAPVKGRTQVKAIRVTGRHIDFIWVPKKAQVASWAVLSGPGVEHRRIRGVKVPVWSGVMGSDHSPVVARITLT